MNLGNRGPGDKPWPEAARAARPYGRGNAAHAAFSRPSWRRARGPVCPLSGPVPDFVFFAPDLYRISPLGQWLFM